MLLCLIAFGSALLSVKTVGAEDSSDFEIIPKNEAVFDISGILPGSEVFGSIVFENNTESSVQEIIFEIENYEDNNTPLFGDMLYIEAKEGNNIILSPISLTDFKNSKGSFSLLPGSKTVDFTIYFDKTAGNKYNMIEEKAIDKIDLKFDLKFIAMWDGQTKEGQVLGVSTSISHNDTILEKIGKVFGASSTGGQIAFIAIASLFLTLDVYICVNRKKFFQKI